MFAYREIFGAKTSTHLPTEHWIILLRWHPVRPREANPEVCIRSFLVESLTASSSQGACWLPGGHTQVAKYRDPRLLDLQTPVFQNCDFPPFHPPAQGKVESLFTGTHQVVELSLLTPTLAQSMKVSIFESQRPFFFVTSLSLCCSCLNGERPWVTEMPGRKVNISKYATWTMGYKDLYPIIMIEECAEHDTVIWSVLTEQEAGSMRQILQENIIHKTTGAEGKAKCQQE